MTESEKRLLHELEDFDSLDVAKGSIKSPGIGAELQNIVGNPVFKAQFNLTVKTFYYDSTGTVDVTPAALPADIQSKNWFGVFGNSDWASGYKKLRQFVQDSVWTLEWLRINDLKSNMLLSIPGAAGSYTNEGDLIIRSKAVSTDTYYRYTIVRCPQVAYGTLLDALNSDTFQINMIRYIVDETQTAQFANNIVVGKQSIFGKTQDDRIDPQTYITGGTYNKNIADIPLNLGIDKHTFLASELNYDVEEISWVVTVAMVKKLRAV